MDIWEWLLHVLIILCAALALGTLSEQLKQSSIIGYLLAGMLVGPSVLGWVDSGKEVQAIAELGVTLLLFSIGLEFSFKSLIRLGPITYIGGTAQILITALAGYLVASMFGLGWRTSLALGLMLSLSSTACVIRVLMDNFSLESMFGRNAVGILLFQDLALILIILVMFSLTGESGLPQAAWKFGGTAGLGVVLFGVFYLVLNHLIPRLLNIRKWSVNREMPILLAIVIALGSAWAAHQAGLSPSIGAFVAGMLLAESPFALQIRADIASLRTLLLTFFFVSIGMLVNPVFVMQHALLVGGLVALIVITKPLIIWVIARFFCVSNGQSLATGVCLGQVGEFSFVLAQIAVAGAIIDAPTFRMVVSVTAITLLLTPYMVRAAPVLARWTESYWPARAPSRMSKLQKGPDSEKFSELESAKAKRPMLIVGFGPAGRRVAEVLLPHYHKQLIVLDINPDNADWAQSLGLEFHVGDAGQREVLEHLQVYRALAIVITVPDPAKCRQIIHLCRSLAPEAKIFVRARYHIFRWEFSLAGAETVIDEEDQVGVRLADEVLKKFNE